MLGLVHIHEEDDDIPAETQKQPERKEAVGQGWKRDTGYGVGFLLCVYFPYKYVLKSDCTLSGHRAVFLKPI